MIETYKEEAAFQLDMTGRQFTKVVDEMVGVGCSPDERERAVVGLYLWAEEARAESGFDFRRALDMARENGLCFELTLMGLWVHPVQESEPRVQLKFGRCLEGVLECRNAARAIAAEKRRQLSLDMGA